MSDKGMGVSQIFGNPELVREMGLNKLRSPKIWDTPQGGCLFP
jgi:hypothetical protein